MGYFDEQRCAACGLRGCLHKKNDAPPNPDSLIDPKCNTCYGKGYVNHQNMVSGKKVDRLMCRCMERNYRKYITERAKKPCSICGANGYCKHRPKTLMQYLNKYGVRSLET